MSLADRMTHPRELVEDMQRLVKAKVDDNDPRLVAHRQRLVELTPRPVLKTKEEEE